MSTIDRERFERFVERANARHARAMQIRGPPRPTGMFSYDAVFRDVHESGLPEEVAAYVADDDEGRTYVVAVLELAPGRSVSLMIDMTVEGFPFSPPTILVDECDVEEDSAAATRVAARLTSPKCWTPAMRPAVVLLMLLVDIRLEVGISA